MLIGALEVVVSLLLLLNRTDFIGLPARWYAILMWTVAGLFFWEGCEMFINQARGWHQVRTLGRPLPLAVLQLSRTSGFYRVRDLMSDHVPMLGMSTDLVDVSAVPPSGFRALRLVENLLTFAVAGGLCFGRSLPGYLIWSAVAAALLLLVGSGRIVMAAHIKVSEHS